MLAKFARNLAMTFSAGIPITDALKLTTSSNTFKKVIPEITRLNHQIKSGIPLHQAMQPMNQFPDLMIQMVKVGEESGRLGEMLSKIADIFESDIERTLKQLNQLLEPLIMLILGVLIGGLVIGMYLPIFKLGSLL
jgi:type IV pilus assembly protein PilC